MEEPQPTRGEQTREEILAAARRLFLSQGYTATTMRQIARAVGVTPAAIYNHFPGKEELFTTILHSTAPYDQLFALLSGIEADTPAAMLQQALQGAIELLSRHRDYVRLAMIDSQERDGATLITILPQVLPHAERVHRRLTALDASLGQLREIPFPVFVRALVSFIAGFMMTEGVIGATQVLHLPDTNWASELADIFMYGVLNPSESRGE